MSDNTLSIVRVTGSHHEVLEVGKRSVPTKRGSPVTLPEAVAKGLLDDGTGRFCLATAPEASVAGDEVARMEAAAKKLDEEAAAKKPEVKKKLGGGA